MKPILLAGLAACVVTAFLVPDKSRASSPLERAAAIKEWRSQCQEPDPDIRLAYMEAAIETGDQSIIRVCLRNALQDESADVRNLGLRAAIAATDKLVFNVTMPEHLDRAFKEAGNDKRKWKEINGWYDTRFWRVVQNGAIFEIDSPGLTSRDFRWYSLIGMTGRSDGLAGDAVVSGDEVVWNGRVHVPNSNFDCVMRLKVEANNRLEGSIKCQRMNAFSLSAPLF